MLISTLFPSFISVQDPSPWDDDIYIRCGSFLLGKNCLQMPSHTSQGYLPGTSIPAMNHHYPLVFCIQSITLFQRFLLDYQHFDINSLTSLTDEPLLVPEFFLFMILSLPFIFFFSEDFTHFAFLKKNKTNLVVIFLYHFNFSFISFCS